MGESKPKSNLLGKILIGIVIASTLFVIYLTVKLFVVSQFTR